MSYYHGRNFLARKKTKFVLFRLQTTLREVFRKFQLIRKFNVYKSTKSVIHILTERFLSNMERSIRHYILYIE